MPAEVRLIAPCGMNCGICRAYLRQKRKCPGCLGEDTHKSASCINCLIRNCETIKEGRSKFCYECEAYPCEQLKQLDKRYRTKYSMSMIENLENIRSLGLGAFTKNQQERWKCPKCGGVICVHNGLCARCGAKSN